MDQSSTVNQAKYSRQILFGPIGTEGQQKIRAAGAVIIGCGALGTAHAGALTRAGIGRLRIVDRDFVEESNLQRQILFDEADALDNLPKAIAAQRKLRSINSEVEVDPVIADIDPRNIESLIGGFNVVLDGTDNFETRYLLNDAAVKLGIPWIYGAAVASSAMTMTIIPGRTPCLACLFPASPSGTHDTCDTVGVIAPAIAWASAVQVTEAIKIVLGRPDLLHGSLLSYDVWENRYQRLKPNREPNCPVCVQRKFTYLEGHVSISSTLCGRDAVQIRPPETRELDLDLMKARLEAFGEVHGNPYLLKCMIDKCELTIFRDGRAVIRGTQDPAVARTLYAKYVGS